MDVVGVIDMRFRSEFCLISIPLHSLNTLERLLMKARDVNESNSVTHRQARREALAHFFSRLDSVFLPQLSSSKHIVFELIVAAMTRLKEI